MIGEELAREVVASFFGAAFSGDPRHVPRVEDATNLAIEFERLGKIRYLAF